MQVCTSLQTDNHTSTPPLSFLQAGCPSCRPTNSVKASTEGDTVDVLHKIHKKVYTVLINQECGKQSLDGRDWEYSFIPNITNV